MEEDCEGDYITDVDQLSELFDSFEITTGKPAAATNDQDIVKKTSKISSLRKFCKRLFGGCVRKNKDTWNVYLFYSRRKLETETIITWNTIHFFIRLVWYSQLFCSFGFSLLFVQIKTSIVVYYCCVISFVCKYSTGMESLWCACLYDDIDGNKYCMNDGDGLRRIWLKLLRPVHETQ